MSPKTVVATPDVCKELERMARDSMGEEKPASKEALDAKSRMLDAYWLQAGPKTEVTPRVR